MYDIEIVLAVTNRSEKYSKRLENFKKHGLLDVEERKVRLSILVGTEKIDDIESGWPNGIEVRVIESNVDHAAAKTNHFYANYSIEDVDATDWIMRVDDDSITRIGPLLNVLDRLNPNDPLYLVNEMVQGDTSVEISILHQFNSVYKNDPLWHEVECCILSKKCIRRIVENLFTLNILRKRATITYGYTDICLTACARECGIFPASFRYINAHTDLRAFLTGNSFHIHYVAHDINSGVLSVINSNRSDCKLCGKTILFWERDANNNVISRDIILLLENGIVIADARPDQLAYWSFEDKTSEINIYRGNYAVEFIFEWDNESKVSPAKFKNNLENQFSIEDQQTLFL